MRNVRTKIVLFLLFLALCPSARAADEQVRVRYLSADHVYLDGGRLEGLEVGMKVQLVQDRQVFAELEVVYVADHSASCVVVFREREVQVGDVAVFEAAPPVKTEEPAEPREPEPRTRATLPRAGRSAAPDQGWKTRGSLALQWDHMADGEDSDLRTDVYRIPFRLKAERRDSAWQLRVRGTLRRINREGFSTRTESGEWRNRIREIALRREGRDDAWHFALGRITNRATMAAGLFDGVAASRRLGGVWRLGGFAGFAPSWDDAGFGTEDRLGGLSLVLDAPGVGSGLLRSNLAAVGRYHQREVSREYLVLASTWSHASGLVLTQSGELDYRRGWRRDAGDGSAVALSGLALTARYRMGSRLTMDLGYDDREPIRTWENRELPDSLFVDAGRRGLRAGLSSRLGGGQVLGVRGSVRSDERTGEDTKSWNASLRWPQFPAAGFRTYLAVRGFSGPWLDGLAPTLAVDRSSRGGWDYGVSGGLVEYSGRVNREDVSSTWAQIRLGRDLTRRLSMAAEYRQDWGGGLAGRRWFLELRRRF